MTRVPPSIRLRLTGWYAGVLAVTLAGYAAITFLAVRHEFFEQLDEELSHDFEAAEERLVRTADGRIVWSRAEHHDGTVEAGRIYEIWSPTGEEIHRSGDPTRLPPVALTAESGDRYETVTAANRSWRTLSAPVTVGAHNVILRVSRDETRLRSEIGEIALVLLLGVPVVVALAGGGGYLLARRALAPIDHLGAEARRITADQLHQRLTVTNPHDEIGRLAAVINDTLARLDNSFDQLRRFTADASHELRTPLAVVRGIGEAAVAERRTTEQYEEAIGSILEEVDRLSNLVDTLLRLSRADAGTTRLTREPLEVGPLVRDVAASLGVLAEERDQRLTIEAPDGILVSADRLLLREALTNVVDNAIKYGPRASTVSLLVSASAHDVVITVTDEGPGVAAEHRERIFERFYRVDEARARDSGGIGLGLAIAKWAVEINGGTIAVDAGRAEGASFAIRVPRHPTVE
jgi:heavy metal sensor kinase